MHTMMPSSEICVNGTPKTKGCTHRVDFEGESFRYVVDLLPIRMVWHEGARISIKSVEIVDVG